jgi:hypothetical protein
MKILKIISIFLFVSSITIQTVEANVLDCIGDSKGTTIHMISDTASLTMNVNGRIHRIVSAKPTIDTENFVTEQGNLVYDSLGMSGDKIILYQHDAKTNNLIAVVPLACHGYE